MDEACYIISEVRIGASRLVVELVTIARREDERTLGQNRSDEGRGQPALDILGEIALAPIRAVV